MSDKSVKKDNKGTFIEKLKYIFKEYIGFVIVFLLVILVKKTIITPIKVNGQSMFSTLHDKDIMILNIIDYKLHDIKRFDIVVIKTPEEYLIKRVIGLPGDEVKYENNVLYINGEIIEDKYASTSTEDFKVVVPKGKYYALGDNRNNSLDSRYFGAFKKKDILGKTSLTIFPFSRFGNKK